MTRNIKIRTLLWVAGCLPAFLVSSNAMAQETNGGETAPDPVGETTTTTTIAVVEDVAVITAFTRGLKKQTQVPVLQTVVNPFSAGQPTFIFEYRQSNAPNNVLKRTDPFMFRFNDERSKPVEVVIVETPVEKPPEKDPKDNQTPVVIETTQPQVVDITNEFVGEVRTLYRRALTGYYQAVEHMSYGSTASGSNA
ncbi:MAG: hypothetical protein ABIH86_00535, partial [Planctomycetota bacterium]